MARPEVHLRWLTAPAQVDAGLADRLTACWAEVSNAGGAVGFPRLPVDAAAVRPAVEQLVGGLDPLLQRLLVAERGEELTGWLVLAGNSSPVTAQWARVLRVQTALAHRRRGIGRALMIEAARAGRADLGLRHLHLELRGGLGLEEFYERLGWQVTGRWPDALDLGDGELRDDVLMVLALR